jgi:hypothetical protein
MCTFKNKILDFHFHSSTIKAIRQGLALIYGLSRESLMKGKLSTDDLLQLISLDQLLFIMKLNFSCYKTTYLNEEVNCTESSPSVSIPWPILTIFS